MEEIWKTVVIDGEVWDNYEVSNLGRVRNLNYKNSGKIEILRAYTNNYGYTIVELRKNGKRKLFRVHRLVAYTFIPNDDPINKTQVNHIDEDKTNNNVINLEWCTHRENQIHGTRSERSGVTRGKKTICLETKQVFDTAKQASEWCGLKTPSGIRACCRNTYESSGKHPITKEKLHWMYYSDYLTQQNN